jgi:hypothetical protein
MLKDCDRTSHTGPGLVGYAALLCDVADSPN